MARSLKVANDSTGVEDENIHNPSWRTGKWSVEEEEYASKLIELFTTGQIILDAFDGRTLRSFLARKLNCDPMRISKKFACLDGMGVRYHQIEFSVERLQANQKLLSHYETAYREKDVKVQCRRIKRRMYRNNPEKHIKKNETDFGGDDYKSNRIKKLNEEDAEAEQMRFYNSAYRSQYTVSSHAAPVPIPEPIRFSYADVIPSQPLHPSEYHQYSHNYPAYTAHPQYEPWMISHMFHLNPLNPTNPVPRREKSQYSVHIPKTVSYGVSGYNTNKRLKIETFQRNEHEDHHVVPRQSSQSKDGDGNSCGADLLLQAANMMANGVKSSSSSSESNLSEDDGETDERGRPSFKVLPLRCLPL